MWRRPDIPHVKELRPDDFHEWILTDYPDCIRARFINKVKSIMMSLNFSSSQLARISLAEFVSKLIFI